MLKTHNGQFDGSNEALLGVVGFLEACAPRMVELVEAAAQGALLEETLMKCLEVNDRLLKVLSDCDGDGSISENSSAVAAASSSTAASGCARAKSDLDVDLDDLLLDSTDEDYKNSTKIGAGKYDGPGKFEDPFGGKTDLLVPTPMKSDSSDFTIDDQEVAGKKDAGDDDFDAFLRERTS